MDAEAHVTLHGRQRSPRDGTVAFHGPDLVRMAGEGSGEGACGEAPFLIFPELRELLTDTGTNSQGNHYTFYTDGGYDYTNR